MQDLTAMVGKARRGRPLAGQERLLNFSQTSPFVEKVVAGIILESGEIHCRRHRAVSDAELSDSLQVWLVKHLDWIKNF